MNTGKFGAYRALQPTKSLSGTVLANENQNRLHRQEQRLLEDRNTAKQEKQQAKEKADGLAYEKGLENLNIKKTGFTSHDEPLAEVLSGPGGVFDTYSKLFDELKKDPNNYKLIAKKQKLKQSIEYLKNLRNGFTQQSQLIQKGLQDGTLSPTLNKDYIDNFNSLMKDYQYKYQLDENGGISVLNLGGTGLPGKLTLEELYDPTKLTAKTKFNANGWLKSVSENYGKFSEKKTENGFTKVYEGFDPSKMIDLTNDVDNLFGTDINSMTDEAKSFIGDTMGLDINKVTKEQFQKIKSDFSNKAIAAFDTKKEKTVDYQALERSDKTKNNQRVKEENNALRKTTDGIVNGIPEYVSALNTISNNLIRRAKYKNGTIEVTDIKINTKGEKQEPTITRIDTTDKKQAALQVASLLRPKEERDNVVKAYEDAEEPVFDIDENKIKLNSIKNTVVDWPEKAKAQDLINQINNLGLEGFEDTSGYFDNKIKGPNGTIYSVNSKKGMQALKDYVSSPKYFEDIKKQDTPEPKPIPNFDPTNF